MTRNPILRAVTDFILLPILVFAFYVQFHGDFGPGGGFQAGVIFAAGIILHALIYGVDKTQQLLPPEAIKIFVSLGVLLFAGVGFVALSLGGNYLDYNALAATALSGQHWGIFFVELGVGITVAAVMIIIFYCFAGRSKE